MVRAPLLAFLCLFLISSAAVAGPSVSRLIERLEKGTDFRVRVHAALELGKSKESKARLALERALDDDNAAVRAAAAAGLKVLGDRRALKALRAHLSDPSPAVQSQVKNTIEVLVARSTARKHEPQVLVQVGKFRNGESGEGRDASDAERASRAKLENLPGVQVVDGEPKAEPRQGDRLPLVMVSGRVKRLDQSREGAAVIYSASVEFVLHRMPGQAIKGILSGSARASGAATEITDREAMAALRRTALEAAVESALSRAPPALLAAAQ